MFYLYLSIGSAAITIAETKKDWGEEVRFDHVRKIIGADWIQPVKAINLPDKYTLLVDEEGLLKERNIVNPTASFLYGTFTHGQPIVGDAIIIKDEFLNDEYTYAWMTMEEAEMLKKEIGQKIKSVFRKKQEEMV